jgi:hypothetical protein
MGITSPSKGLQGIACASAGVVAVVLLSGCASLFTSPAQRQTRAEPYPVVFAAVPPVIDGRLDDAVWQAALRLEPLYEYNTFGTVVDIADIRMAWDRQYLYVAYAVKDQDLHANETERDAVLCRADVAELFIKPPVRDRYEYELYEFEFNLWDVIWDIHFVGYGGDGTPGVTRFSKPFNPDIRCKAVCNGTINDWSDVDDGYTMEVAIPWTAFARSAPQGVKAGDVWRFNAAGYDFSVYRRRPLLFTSVDGNDKGFNQYELYPSMILTTGLRETSPGAARESGKPRQDIQAEGGPR